MDPATMLTLASISYRGCDLNLSDPHSRSLAHDAIVHCLNTFDKVKGKWELVWGPAGFSPGIVGLDVSAMYVARQLDNKSQIAVVVRGTNFYSLTDWFSNLLIDQRPWPYADATNSGARVSRSTALGLNILQRLRSGPPQAIPPTGNLWSKAQSWFGSDEARLGYTFLSLLAGANSSANSDVVEAVARWIGNTTGAGLSNDMLSVVHRIDSAVTHASSSDVDETALLARVEQTQQRIDSGVALVDFLRACVDETGSPVDLYVTGHSKGGPLAVALATWLADTQATQARVGDQWDPSRKAKIHCYTFAAPTAGNSSFAAQVKSRLAYSYRLFNPLDLVPHVWNVVEAAQIPGLYSNKLQILEGLVGALTPVLTRLDYQHETPAEVWPPGLPEKDELFEEIAFEHLDAYLRKLGILGGDLTFTKLFEPLP